MRIMNFLQFLNESLEGGYSSFESLPKPLKDFFINSVGKNILSKVVGLKNFSVEIQGSEVYFFINGNKILVPFINYNYDQVVPNIEALKDDSVIDSFYNSLDIDLYTSGLLHNHAQIYAKILSDEENQIVDRVKFSYRGKDYIFYDYDIESNLSSLFYIIFSTLRNVLKNETPLLNPFTDIDLNNNPLIKILDKLGAYIDTSEARKKQGTLRFSLRDFNYGLIIQSNGYIRIDHGGRTPILTSKMEISTPAYTEDDLNLKLTYLVIYLMKDVLKKYGIPIKTINLIAKYYSSGEFNDYNKLIKEVSLKYPAITSLLPDPQSVLDPDVKKGSSMLRRFGII